MFLSLFRWVFRIRSHVLFVIYSWWFWTWVFHSITKYGVRESRYTYACMYSPFLEINNAQSYDKTQTPQACDKRIVMHNEKNKCVYMHISLQCTCNTSANARSFTLLLSFFFVIGWSCSCSCSSRFEYFFFTLYAICTYLYVLPTLFFLSTFLMFVCLKKIHLPLLAITHQDACCSCKLQFSSGWFRIGRWYERRILFC